MKKSYIITLISLLFTFTFLAQEKKETKTTFAIMPIHNSGAGFNNVFLGSYELKPRKKLTFYSVFWVNPSFGNQGKDLFLETGIGLGFTSKNKKWYINPSLGFGHGKLLSQTSGTKIAESIIPSLFLVHNSGRFEFEAYTAYYKSLRGQGNSQDLMLNWVIPGFKVNKHFSLGGFYEHLGQTRVDNGKKVTLYQFLGGYLKATMNNGVWFRFAFGPNISGDNVNANEFYKIQAFIPI
ncbi:hypothetical protein CXF68_13675 [Tenacibaculum sp. Bg11-29]|uniref:DUF6733 family protein n=1 Tax=Tenacibaculum sp. Bg11-29 TaxID=2058306 RepID=UPI000C343E88|nr:DUF6733 family protein [Tenacibaculum sp. Bg11-29]PKH51668.1 hypothetical protein CXF68_13675 [Tenacibaculum sp. Bg11-29]